MVRAPITALHSLRYRSTQGHWPGAILENFFESTGAAPPGNAIWCYTDQVSYTTGETVELHVSTTANTFHIAISRDGYSPQIVYEKGGLRAAFTPAPVDASVSGCAWPVALKISIPSDWRSGGYVVQITGQKSGFSDSVHHHIFILRPKPATCTARLLLVASTCTWNAYNDWGGSNAYEGITGATGDQFSPQLSIQRPFSRGFVWLPLGAPRIPLRDAPLPGAVPRYPHMEWAYANGFSKKYASAGWASYDRHFVHWLESQGIAVDVIAQQDLHSEPDILSAYACVAFVGHDEYWSWEMRDAVDRYVENGGKAARFAGNFLWQIRLQKAGTIQICYKYRAHDEDPVRLTAESRRLTSAWEDPVVARPGVDTFGLNALRGMYAGWGTACPRGPGGFTVYRPEHWAFESTDLYYGDLLGADAKIFGYEVDGLDYGFRAGLPYPTEADGAPDTLEIIAMGLATMAEADHRHAGSLFFLGEDDLTFAATITEGSATPAACAKRRHGSGMIVAFQKGKGAVFHAGSCEWVAGLIRRDPAVEQVTRNVLNRFGAV
jgi:hypothetical protein